MEISELTVINDIERLEAQYCDLFGSKPLNISWWNPSNELKTKLLAKLNLNDMYTAYDPIDYHFSYDHQARKKLVKAFGFSPEKKACLITPTGSTSLLCVLNWVKMKNSGVLYTLSPHYFSVSYNTESLGIRMKKQYIRRLPSGYEIDIPEYGENDVIWITNPIYCTGISYSERSKSVLRKVLDSGTTLIADECLSQTGRELSHEFGNYANFIGIYCPHKSVCINGIKFSAVIFDKTQEDFFDQWSDILYGCLSVSNTMAIDHFLSPNFKKYEAAFQIKMDKAWAYIEELLSQYPGYSYDKNSSGYLRTLFFPRLDALKTSSSEKLWQIIYGSGTSFIPSIRNHFSPDFGFGFRINLALDSPLFRGALNRLLNTVSSI